MTTFIAFHQFNYHISLIKYHISLIKWFTQVMNLENVTNFNTDTQQRFFIIGTVHVYEYYVFICTKNCTCALHIFEQVIVYLCNDVWVCIEPYVVLDAALLYTRLKVDMVKPEGTHVLVVGPQVRKNHVFVWQSTIFIEKY